MPEIPIICDPSHIAGNRDAVAELSQIALDLAMDGLMIETHADPDKAMSDARQQIKPDTLKSILLSLKFRKPEGNGSNGEDILKMLRREMDEVDSALLEILARRLEIASKIGIYKKNHNMTILQVQRWQETILDRMKKGVRYGLDENLVKSIWELLHKQSFKIQSELLNRTD
jgi:chorismate mutase